MSVPAGFARLRGYNITSLFQNCFELHFETHRVTQRVCFVKLCFNAPRIVGARALTMQITSQSVHLIGQSGESLKSR